MTEIRIDTASPYRVMIGSGLLEEADKYIQKLEKIPESVVVVTDTNVGPLYADRILDALEDFHPSLYTVPAGEENKTPDTLISIVRALVQHGLTRSDLVIALGGGVVGDMAGFASAIYLRGIRFVQCPTTLLSAVDASVGGKTAVDLPEGKNLVGAFHQPSMVICDTDTFKTLPEIRIADGAAEMIKHAMIADTPLLEQMRDPGWKIHIEETVARNIEIKRSFVLGDEKDQGKRQMLNFGHTIGHAIEAWSGFRLTHGQAVAIGMVMETRAARKLGFTDMDENELIRVLEANHLPVTAAAPADQILHFALHDKKRQSKGINVVIPRKTGQAELRTLDPEQFKQYIGAALI